MQVSVSKMFKHSLFSDQYYVKIISDIAKISPEKIKKIDDASCYLFVVDLSPDQKLGLYYKEWWIKSQMKYHVTQKLLVVGLGLLMVCN